MIKPITSVKLSGRRVLLRVGFDVPLEELKSGGFKVADDSRIKSALPTIEHLVKGKAKIIIISHLGRPQGKWDKDLGMLPIAEKLAELTGRKLVKIKGKLPTYKSPKHVFFLTEDITLNDHSDMSKTMADGDILFLENVRFYAGEEKNDIAFGRVLAKYGDIYVNECFSVAHHKSVSNVGLAGILPAYAGINLLKEISALNKAIKNPNKPVITIIGGAKISDKIETINFLAGISKKILIGGAIANSFFKALGYEIGNSKAAEIFLAKQLLRHYKDKIVLPVDVVVSKYDDAQAHATKPEKVRNDEYIYDIGPETVRKFSEYIKQGKTLIWNGPLGMIEKKKYSFGSMAIAQVFASRTKGYAYGVVGGGESVEVVDRAKVTEFIDHVSTGGGAMLEFMSGKTLPAIKALDK
jgi:phosphoglycerate kinase